jgi:hypothetical protein
MVQKNIITKMNTLDLNKDILIFKKNQCKQCKKNAIFLYDRLCSLCKGKKYDINGEIE